MNVVDIARLIAQEINSQSQSVTASADINGNVILTSKAAGTETGLADATLYSDEEGPLASGNFSSDPGREILTLVGNQGDTYFQRWDSMKTYPRSDDDTNQVIDIASVMLESHINLDGRTDSDRGVSQLADIDYANFGKLNRAYSQKDNFMVGRDTDESLNLDSYRSSITWSGQKNSSADIDEWTHVSLASSLALDGDKGPVQALRRFRNTILAFQNRGISEILFNSRTQLATSQGVPVEIANTGKVDGKRYITNKYGTTNKWSIVEGKLGLYFIDNINRIIGRFSGEGIESLSTKNGLDAWVRDNHGTEPWDPRRNRNFVSYFDQQHSDVYFLKDSGDQQPCLVYNEVLDCFTGFFDYDKVPMMTNVGDRFLAFRSNHLWLQNEGLYCNFFGVDKPFWITWRVTPDEFTDKIWSNIEYRADFLTTLDSEGDPVIDENALMSGQDPGGSIYDKDKTFDTLTVWNEYQTTGETAIPANDPDDILPVPDVRKKFRIWRLGIPRASVTESNNFGLDRIRNPWVFVKLKKNGGNFGQQLMQLHDVTVKYFEE